MENLGKGIDLAYMRNQLEKIPNYNVEELFKLAMEQNIFIGDIDTNEWKSVKDVLPKEREPVLVYHTGDYPKGYNNMQVCYLRDIGWEEEPEWDWANADSSFSFSDITHWKYLPEPPILNTTNNA